MGQKVHPVGIRLGISADWNSKWYADGKDFAKYVHQDFRVREFLHQELSEAMISRIQIERPANALFVTIHTARPGQVIGRKGEDIEKLRNKLSALVKMDVASIKINTEEITRPDADAYLVAKSVAQQLEKRVMFRRAMKKAVTSALRSGALGIRINVSGRLNGAEIARMEWYREGRVPLHTFRADVDYGFAEALTTYGIIGIKVWIFKGEVFSLEEKAAKKAALPRAEARSERGERQERRRNNERERN
jgi:small subunit ribosomal protein S3